MNINELKPADNSVKERKRRGRGNASGLGGEAGRGHKGQKSRSGYSRRAGFEGGQTPFYRRVPKKRGFGRIGESRAVVNLGQLQIAFADGDVVSLATLKEKGLCGRKDVTVKVCAKGTLEKSLVFEGVLFSKSAAELVNSMAGEKPASSLQSK